MNTQFVKLPSGTYLNLSSIHTAYPRQGGEEVRFCFSSSDGDYFDEPMTAEQLDSLLSPPQSPIVSPVIDLDRLKPGAPVHFTTPSGEHRHGILEFIGTNYGSAFLSIRSDGEQFTIFPEQQNVSK